MGVGTMNGVQYFACKPGHGVFVLWGTCSPAQPKPKFKTPRKKKKRNKAGGKTATGKTKKKRKASSKRRYAEGELVQTERDGAMVTGNAATLDVCSLLMRDTNSALVSCA